MALKETSNLHPASFSAGTNYSTSGTVHLKKNLFKLSCQGQSYASKNNFCIHFWCYSKRKKPLRPLNALRAALQPLSKNQWTLLVFSWRWCKWSQTLLVAEEVGWDIESPVLFLMKWLHSDWSTSYQENAPRTTKATSLLHLNFIDMFTLCLTTCNIS